jgi:hypothetical protein
MAALSRCLPDPDLFAGFMDGADRSSSVDVPGLDSRDAQWDRFSNLFRYTLILPPQLEGHQSALLACLEQSPVRTTLSKTLEFAPGGTE